MSWNSQSSAAAAGHEKELLTFRETPQKTVSRGSEVCAWRHPKWGSMQETWMQPFLWSLLIRLWVKRSQKANTLSLDKIDSSTLRASAGGGDCRRCWLSFLLLYRPQILLHAAITIETGYSTPMNSRSWSWFNDLRMRCSMLYCTVKLQRPNLWMAILSCMNKVWFGFISSVLSCRHLASILIPLLSVPRHSNRRVTVIIKHQYVKTF